MTTCEMMAAKDWNFAFFLLQTGQDLLPLSYGCASIKVGCVGSTSTEILVAVKAEVNTPDLQTPNCGKVVVNVDWFAAFSASHSFLPHPSHMILDLFPQFSLSPPFFPLSCFVLSVPLTLQLILSLAVQERKSCPSL